MTIKIEIRGIEEMKKALTLYGEGRKIYYLQKWFDDDLTFEKWQEMTGNSLLSPIQYPYRNEGRLAKFWVSNLMASNILREIWDGDCYYGGGCYFNDEKFVNRLEQILKKEWIR